MDKSTKFGIVYFFIFGIVVLGFGLSELILGFAGRIFTRGIIRIGGEFLVWRGIILVFAGIFYLSSLRNFTDIHSLAKLTVASIILWIIAGMNILSIFLGSIPGEERWINTGKEFIKIYSPPYTPALFLLIPSLFVIFYIKKGKQAK
jgi:hypothetical protein